MQTGRIALVLTAIVIAAACTQYGSTSPSSLVTDTGLAAVSGQGGGKSPATAVMQFGQANVGSPFPPTSGHDQSGHAVDNVVPRTVVISVDGTVTFNIPPGVHQINIYKPGTQPEDVDTSFGNLTTLAASAGCAQPFLPINALLVIGTGGANFEAAIPVPCLTPAQKTYTFDTPGRYLVICSFLPHFQTGMYGWVEVKGEA